MLSSASASSRLTRFHSKGGIAVDPSKVKDVLEWETPQTVKEVGHSWA